MTYSAEVLADSPLAYWRLGDASGTTATDSSGHGRSATYVNSPTLGVTGLLSGDADTAVSLAAASSQYVNYVTDATVQGLTNWSLEILLKPASTGQSGLGLVSRAYDATTASVPFVLGLGDVNVDRPFAGIHASGVWHKIEAPSALSTATVYHLAATFDGTTIRLYVNGAQVATLAPGVGSPTTNTLDTYVGRRWDTAGGGGVYFNGVIDEAAIYGTALSAARISAHYTASTAPPTDFAATGSDAHTGTATLTASRTFAATGSITATGTAAFLASRDIHAAGTDTAAGAAAFTGIQTFGASGVDEHDGETSIDEEYPPPVLPTRLTARARKIMRRSYSYSTPTVDTTTGRITRQTRTLVTAEEVGTFQFICGHRDRTYWRDVQTEITRWSHANQFGFMTASIRLPQVTPLEQPGAGELDWFYDGARAGIYLRLPGGTRSHTWALEGKIHNLKPVITADGFAYEGEIKGFLFIAGDQVQKPLLTWQAYRKADLGHRIVHSLNYNVISRGYPPIPERDIGIGTRKLGTISQSVLDFARDLLALAWTTDQRQWTVIDVPGPGRRGRLQLLDWDTVDYTISFGQDGVDWDVDGMHDELPNVVYGEWVDPNGGRHANVKYPFEHPDNAPAYPLAPGVVFSPGDGHTGFAPFSGWLRDHGYNTVVSGDTYLAADVDEVEDAQEKAGITIDGIVGAQTWGTIFSTGSNVGDLDSPFFMPIAADHRVMPKLYNSDGQDLGPNPDYDPTIPRREIYINFGEGLTRAEVNRSARQIVARSRKLSLVGTVVLRSDPEECSRLLMRSGTTLNARHLLGAGGVKFHVVQVDVDNSGDERAVTLTIDTLARDAWTVAQIIERRREARSDPARQIRSRQQSSKLAQTTQPVFDADNAAGKIYPHTIQGGFWRVVKFPVAAWGTFVQVISSTAPDAKFALRLFSRPVTANQVAAVEGNPFGHGAADRGSTLGKLNALGLIEGWGWPDAPCGYWPDSQGENTAATLTGDYRDDLGLEWASDHPPWLWLAEYSPTSTEIQVTFRNSPVTY